jgi:hypothetical protein
MTLYKKMRKHGLHGGPSGGPAATPVDAEVA